MDVVNGDDTYECCTHFMPLNMIEGTRLDHLKVHLFRL
jgi:hypothetical protein